MKSLSKVISSIVEQGRRILKVREYGVKTAFESAPFGDDSNPLADMTAIYAHTSENGEAVVIGYINENQIAQPGEKRLYSLNAAGQVQTYVYLKADGVLELGGAAKSAIRYEDLDSSLQNLVTLINAELAKIQTGIIAAGGTYPKQDVSIDTSAAKVDNVKLP